MKKKSKVKKKIVDLIINLFTVVVILSSVLKMIKDGIDKG